MKEYYNFWGKTDDKGNWHPLVCHMLDVAAVGQVWLENDPVIFSVFKDNIGVSEYNDCEVVRLLSFVSALHDIGKATICFQNKIPKFAKEAGVYDENRIHLSFDHGLYGVYWISQYENAQKQDNRSKSTKHMGEYLVSIGGFSSTIHQLEDHNISDLFVSLLKAACWHHGSIYESSQVRGGMQLESSCAPMYETVNAMRNDLLVSLSEFFKIDDLNIVIQDIPSCALSRLFAGFVSVCDWIASSNEVFRSDFTFNLEEHFAASCKKGVSALKKYGLISNNKKKVNRSFTDFFGFSPRGVQSKIEEVLDENPASFYIIEAPTGEGKSEAAFYTHYKLTNKGLYFALPSQATANQMYGRVTHFLDKQMDHKTVTVLAHGFAWLSEEYKSHKQKAKKWDESSGYTSHDEWFFTKKKTLLATTGVGTVDQVMLSVLNTRHYFVKLFALAGKTLIIDEVHAYDYFMIPIIKQLLEWCFYLQINVILLSATLPVVMKRDLLQGYTGCNELSDTFTSKNCYPLITTVDRYKSIKQYPVDSTRKKEEIAITLKKHQGDVSKLVTDILDKVKSGGNVLWICNTVKRAQDVYSILAKYDLQDCALHLFHSRFTYRDRISKESTVTELYGKGDDEKPNKYRPQKSILVATQVVEQSLDVDFDFLVTDIAPVDLLLQRFGRMHRHNKNNANRSKNVSQPHAYVLVPEIEIEGPIKRKKWSIPNDLKGFAEVYDPLTIYRTIKALSENRSITLPEMYRTLVEDVYAEKTEFADFYNNEYDLSIEKTVWENSFQYYTDTKAEMIKESKKYLTVKASKDILKSAALTPTGNEEDSNAISFIAKTRYGNELNLSFIVSHENGDSIVVGNETIQYQSDFSDILDIDLQKIIIENSVKVASPMSFILELIKGEISLLAESSQWEELQAKINKVPSLRDHYLLILDSNNTLIVENYIICYETLSGLTITKKEVV